MRLVALGLDIGGTKTAGAVVGPDGAVLDAAETPTPAADGPDAVLGTAAALGVRLRDRAADGGAHVVGAGVGTAGTVDPVTGTVRYATSSLPGWTGTPVAARLGAALGLPVVVDNDVRAVAFGEAQQAGEALATGLVLFVAVGTGVGGALLRDGRLDHGATGAAGDVAHLVVGPPRGRHCGCGRRGHLEAVASGPAIAAAYAARTATAGAPAADLRVVAARAAGGDAVAQAVIAEGAAVLGRALGGLVNVLDPVAVVVGGGVPGIGPCWWEPMEAALRAECLPGPAAVTLRPARLGARAGVVGAALLGLAALPGSVTAVATGTAP